ncbi:MAG: 3'-5' exonuclease [Lewinellaceae bacterium]|nr:3'-5' exonuclease [Lewinellaceae bacterium]
MRWKFWQTEKSAVPAWWQTYQRELAMFSYAPETALGELRFVVLDTETNGLNPRNAALLSIGAITVKDWSIHVAEQYATRLEPPHSLDPEAIKIHGILPGPSSGQVDSESALAALVSLVGTAIIVGHHVRFDLAVINRELRRLTGGTLRNPTLDTIDLARRLKGNTPYSNPGDYTLDKLAEEYQLRPADRHTAPGDAFLTGLLLLKLLRRLEDRGVKTYRDLMR